MHEAKAHAPDATGHTRLVLAAAGRRYTPPERLWERFARRRVPSSQPFPHVSSSCFTMACCHSSRACWRCNRCCCRASCSGVHFTPSCRCRWIARRLLNDWCSCLTMCRVDSDSNRAARLRSSSMILRTIERGVMSLSCMSLLPSLITLCTCHAFTSCLITRKASTIIAPATRLAPA